MLKTQTASIILALTMTGCCALEGPRMSSRPAACLAEPAPANQTEIPYVGLVTRVGCFEAECVNIILVTSHAYTVKIPKEFNDMPIAIGSQVFLSPWEVCIDNGSEIRCLKR